MEEGRLLRVVATPTYYVNGTRYMGARTTSEFRDPRGFARPSPRPVSAPGRRWARSDHERAVREFRHAMKRFDSIGDGRPAASVAGEAWGLRSRVSSGFLWLLGVAVIVRLVLLLPMGDLDLAMDELQYQEIAVNLAEGRGFALNDKPTSWRPPLYPFLLSLVYRVAGTTDPLAARVFQAGLSLLNLMLVYLLGRRLFGERVGLGAAVIFAFYPSFLFYNNHLLTEGLFTCLLTLTAYGLALYLGSGRALLPGPGRRGAGPHRPHPGDPVAHGRGSWRSWPDTSRAGAPPGGRPTSPPSSSPS